MAERDINGEIAALDATLKSIEAVLDLGKLRKEQVELETQAGVPDLWSDPEAAQKVTSALSRVNSTINKVSSLRSRVTDLPIMLELANNESISRMFFRYCERHNYGVSVLETSYGEEAGIKSTTFKVSGPYCYGTLSVEQGTHRLVRISPFDSQNRRHTSFAGVEVVPVVDQSDDIEIDEKDIRIDVYRSSGPGGQGVNTTDSAVRITHIPTGIVVSCQNERSQIQNRATAMAVLQSKLLERRNAQERAKIDALRGDTSGSWGNQIRSYVLHPYQMVKDHRTDFETGNTQAVLDGDLDGFISAGIRWRRERK